MRSRASLLAGAAALLLALCNFARESATMDLDAAREDRRARAVERKTMLSSSRGGGGELEHEATPQKSLFAHVERASGSKIVALRTQKTNPLRKRKEQKVAPKRKQRITAVSKTDAELRDRRRRKKRRRNRALMALLLAYKMKFMALIPTLMGGLILLISKALLAGFFFALFAAVLGLKNH